jgi:hypothetical protein
MISKLDKLKKWRPRFSIRTLVIVVTLVCLYAACWGPTKRQGVDDVLRYVDPGRVEQMVRSKTRIRPNGTQLSPIQPSWISPLWSKTATFGESATLPLLVGVNCNAARHYYFWFFGYVAKMPYEHDLPAPS